MSFPRAGQICAAQILAELGDVRERFPIDAQLAAEAGAVPLTYESGKTRSVTFRWACNHRLRLAITCLADNSRHATKWVATRLHRSTRSRLRSPARDPHPRPRMDSRFVAIVERSLRRTTSAKHRAALRLNTVGG